jgi:hypothetical protein
VSRPHSCVCSLRKLTPSSSTENKYGNPHTPLNALISGPLVGGNWDAGDPAPRSVTLDWWHKVCPESDIQTIFTDELKDPVRELNGDVIFRRMVDVIRDAPGRCVEVVSSPTDNYPQLYDLWMIGNERSIPLSELFINTSTSRCSARARSWTAPSGGTSTSSSRRARAWCRRPSTRTRA